MSVYARTTVRGFGFVVAASLLLMCEVPSTDAICEDACHAWDTCFRDPHDIDIGRYCDWDYVTCFDECKDDGDWTSGYVNCVEDQHSCCDIEDVCG